MKSEGVISVPSSCFLKIEYLHIFYIPSAVPRGTSHRSEHTIFVSSGLRRYGAHRSEGHDRQRH